MTRKRLFVTTCLLIGAALAGCGVDLTGTPDWPDVPSPWPPEFFVNPAIAVQLLPRLTDSVGKVFGTVRDGSYIDSLRVRFFTPSAMILWAGLTPKRTHR